MKVKRHENRSIQERMTVSSRGKWKLFGLTVLMICGWSSAAFAQSASLSGRVIDPSGGIVRSAEVMLSRKNTGTTLNTKANSSGLYAFPFVQPGVYDLNVNAAGFKNFAQTNITIETGQSATVEVRLELGSQNQTINVDGSGISINTTDGSVSTVVDRQFVENMPLNGRSFQSLLTMAPGVAVVPSQGVGYSGEMSVNGQRTEANYFTVDGVSANTGAAASLGGFPGNGAGVSGSTPGESALGTTQNIVSIDALQEFRATTSSYSAEYGRTPGGQFSFTTRSGTNDWHGSLFEYFRNDALDAANWFNNAAGLPKSEERQNDFGGTLGGPVRIPGVYNGKDKTFFFFSYEGLRSSLPAVTTAGVPTVALRQQAPAALQPYLNAFPLPNATSQDMGDGQANTTYRYSNPSSLDSASIRIDHAISDNMKIFARYSHSPSSAGARNTSDLAINQPTVQAYDSITAGATNTFSPILSNDLRFNFTRHDADAAEHVDDFGGAIPFSVTDIPSLTARSQVFFNINYDLYPGIFLAPQSTSQHQINITDNFSAVLGRHTWKWGIDYRRLGNFQSVPDVQVQAQFSNESQILINQPRRVNVFPFFAPLYPVYTNFSAFGQDEWKINSRLTLSLGLRWELNPSPHDANGNNPYTVTTTDLATMQLAPKNAPLWRTTWHNFAPRIGLAYQLHQSQAYNTVLRMGGGLFYDTGNTQASLGYNGIGYSGAGTFTGVPFPPTTQQINSVPATSTASPYNNVVYGFDPDLKLPYSLQWNFAIEQGLGEKQTLTLNYLGAVDHQLLMTKIYDPSLYGNAAFSAGDGVYLTTNGGNSSYNALQVRYQRQLSHGIQALISYSWSHALDDSTTNFAVYQKEWASSDYDIRHMLQAALTYDLPGTYQAPILNHALKHWSLDLRFFARSALPVDVVGPTQYNNLGQEFSYHPNLVPGQPLYIQDPNAPGGRVINYNAFTLVTDSAGNVVEGNLGRNAFRGFDAVQTDLAIRRDFRFGEKVGLQFRAEAFNILNHPVFGSIYHQLSNGLGFFGYASNTLNTQLGGLSPLYQVGGPRSLQLSLRLHF